MKTQVLNLEDLREIAQLGRERSPVEACGILLPVPFKGKRVWEMPNRSTIPNHFEMWPADIELELSSWFKHPSHHGLGEEVVIWHTHPSGNVGPSPSDREQRIPDLANLIVAVTEDEKPIATFF